MSLFAEEELEAARLPAAAPPSDENPPLDQPLAARMRPRTLEEFAGQRHLVGPDAPLRRVLAANRLPSAIFYGPAGTGKTTLARLLSTLCQARFEQFSAVTGSVQDVRRLVGEARERIRLGRDMHHAAARTVLFVDEIHRFNRAQQDAFLPHVEDGTVTLLGATTENPLATVNTPLLSRCRLFRFLPLEVEDLQPLLRRAVEDERGLRPLEVTAADDALQYIAAAALGDARSALNSLEMAADLAGPGGQVTEALARQAVERRALDYDLSGDNHYHIISAYIKSLRGGDPDAALYWMARMLHGGEDPLFIARRLVIQAAEDIGNADPHALPLAMAAFQAIEKIGLPEGAIPLAQATIYVASAPKSNASYLALNAAREAVENQPPVAVPYHLRAASLPGSRERLGEGIGYRYPHDFPGHFVEQEYLPEAAGRAPWYQPVAAGEEAHIRRRLAEWWERWRPAGTEPEEEAD